MVNSFYDAIRRLIRSEHPSGGPDRRLIQRTQLLIAGGLLTATALLVVQYYRAYIEVLASINAWTFDTAASYDFDTEHVVVADGTASLAASWWNGSFAVRQIVQLYNASGEDLAAGTPVTVSLPQSAIGSLQADCDDLRVVYDGGTPTELSRAARTEPGGDCTSGDAIRVTFPLQAGLTAGAGTSDYYVYADNAGATAPATPTAGWGADALLALDLRDTTGVGGETATTGGALRSPAARSALSFDGYDDYARIGDAPSLDIADNLTLEAWVHPDRLPSVSGYLIYRANAYFLRITAAGHLEGGVHNGTTFVTATSTGTVGTGAFTHVAMTFDADAANDQIKLWRGGAHDGSATLTAGPNPTDAVLDLGGNGTANSFAGRLEEVRVSAAVRYHAAFTPSTAPHLSDADTAVLLHADAFGAGALFADGVSDDSPYGNDATRFGTGYAEGGPASAAHGAFGGVMVERATTNLIPNPSYEHGTYDTGWTASGLTATANSTASYVQSGSTSARLANGSGSAATYVTSVDPDATTVSLSAYVFNATTGSIGGPVDASVAELHYDGGAASGQTFTDTGGGWWRITADGFSVTDAARNYGLTVKAGHTVYLDAVQLEARATATSYADGSLGTGYAWTGTADNSPSTRAAATLRYPTAGDVSASAGSVSLWVRPAWDGDDGQEHVFFDVDTAAGTLKLAKTAAGALVLGDGVQSASRTVTGWTAGTWYHVVGTWGGGALQIYENAVAGTAANAYAAPTLGTNLHIGSDNAGQSQADALIDEVVIYDDVLSAAEVVDLYRRRLVRSTLTYPVVANTATAPAYSALSAFAETPGGGHSGGLGYQLSPDGVQWYFYSGSAWVPAGRATDRNNATTVNAQVAGFPAVAGAGQFHFRAYLEGQSPVLDTVSLTYENTPAAPTDLYADNTTAQSGRANPADLTDTTPAFSAIYRDSDSGDTAGKARIQVSTDPTFTSVTHWDSGAAGMAISAVDADARSGDLVYGSFGAALTQSLSADDGNTTYYFRIKFWDANDNEGAWSDAAHFGMQDTPAAPTGLNFSSVAPDGFTIAWTDPNSGQTQEANFTLHHSTDGDDYTEIAQPAADSTSAVQSGLSPDTEHFYKLNAVNATGASADSVVLSGYTAAAVPTLETIANTDYGQVRIIVGANDNPTGTTFALAVSADDFAADTRYVQNDHTLGATLGEEDWQTLAEFGGAEGFVLSGLNYGTTYSFRIKARNTDGLETAYGDTTQRQTWERPSLAVSVLGTAAGSVDLTGQNDKIHFGYMLPGAAATGVQRVSIESNASDGYTVAIRATAKLTNAEDPNIDVDFVRNGTVGTNTSPVAWAAPTGTLVGEDTAFLGYRTSDAGLASGTVNRFANADRWAGFDTLGEFYEILYHNDAGSGADDGEEYADITFKLETNNLHPTGNYGDLVVQYKIVPIF